MKKYINLLNLVEVVLYFVIINILFAIENKESYSLYFTIVYWGIIFVINICYYTLNFIKKQKTPKISIYSPTAFFGYLLSVCGMAFVNIKNHSYIEFIKSANDYKNMTKKQRIQSFLYYFLIWIVILMLLLFIYFENDVILLLASLILIYRIFMLYDFANKKEVKNNE